MNIIKSANIFLSVFGYTLYCDPKESANLDQMTIVDEKGLAVGYLLKKEDGNYIFNISSLRCGDISGEVILTEFKDSTKYSFTSTIDKNSSCIENKQYEKITNNMDIVMPNPGFEGVVQIDNKLFVFHNNELIFAFNVSDRNRKIIFFTPTNEVAISKNNDFNRYIYSATNGGKDKINIYFENGVLEYDYTGIKGTPNMCGTSEISGVDTPIESICKLAVSIGKEEGMSSIKDPNFFIREFRRLCCFGEELFLFNNIASITLGEHTSSFNKNDMMAIFGFVPWELPNTPIINEDGMVLSPKDKKRKRRIA